MTSIRLDNCQRCPDSLGKENRHDTRPLWKPRVWKTAIPKVSDVAVCVKRTKLRLDCSLLIAGVASWSEWFEPSNMTRTDHSETLQLSQRKQTQYRTLEEATGMTNRDIEGQ